MPNGIKTQAHTESADDRRLSVDETRTILVRWKPFSWSAVASSTRFAKASATNLAERAETSPSATAAEPDPPDKRQRPRTGNPRAREVLVRAAAKSRYFSVDLASSLLTRRLGDER
jgi:hypothetical protein